MMGCSNAVEPAADDARDPAQTTAALQTTPDGCPLPVPKVRGCKIACKPCLIPSCENGKWVYESYDWDGCSGGGGVDPSICTVSVHSFCPPECTSCEYF